MPERARAQDSRLAKTCHGDLQKGSEDWKEVLPGVRAGVYFIDSGEFAEDSGDGEMSEPQTNWVNEEDPVKARLKYILDSPPHDRGGFHTETVRTALEALARIEELEAQLAQEEAPSPTDGALPKLPNLMAEMRRIARAHHDGGGCLEEHCGCPGSRLAGLIRELQAEFGGVVAERKAK